MLTVMMKVKCKPTLVLDECTFYYMDVFNNILSSAFVAIKSFHQLVAFL